MLSLLGYPTFNHAEICSGDQSRISLLATIVRSFSSMARRHTLGRRADSQARRSVFTGSIQWTPAVTRHLPAHRRHRPLQPFSDLTNRRTGSISSLRCLPARPASAFAANTNKQQELSRRAASRRTDCNHGPYQRRDQFSCNDSPAFPIAPHVDPSPLSWKASPVFLVPLTSPLEVEFLSDGVSASC